MPKMTLVEQVLGSLGFCGKSATEWEGSPHCRSVRISASVHLADTLDMYSRTAWYAHEQMLPPTTESMEIIHYVQVMAADEPEGTLTATWNCCYIVIMAHIHAVHLSTETRPSYFAAALRELLERYPRQSPSNFRMPAQ